MKLRLSGNTLRFRLGKSDVQQLIEKGRVTSKIAFGYERDQELSYSLERHDQTQPDILYQSGTITAYLSEEQVTQLLKEDLDGTRFETALPTGHLLHVSVERDYKCLHPTAAHNESDSFTNPKQSHTC